MKVVSILILAVAAGYASGTICMTTLSNCVTINPADTSTELDVPVSWAHAITPANCCLSCKQLGIGATSFGLYFLEPLDATGALTDFNEYQVCRCYKQATGTPAPGGCIAGYGIASIGINAGVVGSFSTAVGTEQLYTIM